MFSFHVGAHQKATERMIHERMERNQYAGTPSSIAFSLPLGFVMLHSVPPCLTLCTPAHAPAVVNNLIVLFICIPDGAGSMPGGNLGNDQRVAAAPARDINDDRMSRPHTAGISRLDIYSSNVDGERQQSRRNVEKQQVGLLEEIMKLRSRVAGASDGEPPNPN